MATEALISWNAPEHIYTEKKSDWYWAVGIITLALAAVAFMFGQVIPALFVIVAAVALVIHASYPARRVPYEINDRGIMAGDVLYPFTSLESFWIPHNQLPPRLIVKSRQLFMPFIVIYIDEIDPEDVRAIMLTYLAETEHQESVIKHLLERVGF